MGPVLLVDTRGVLVGSAARDLERVGYVCRVAESPSSAVQIVGVEPPAVVVFALDPAVDEGISSLRDLSGHAPVVVTILPSDAHRSSNVLSSGASAVVVEDDAFATRLVEQVDAIVAERGAGRGNTAVTQLTETNAILSAEARVRLQTTVLEHVPSAVVVTTLDGTVQYVNHFAEQLLGRSAQDMLGRDVRPLLFSETQLAKGLPALDAIRSGHAWRGELDIQRVAKPPFPALLSVRLIDGPPEAGPLVLGVIVDLSDRRGLEAKLLQAQKMEAVGTLAGGLAHDFNNLLTGVLGSSALLREVMGSDSQHDDLIDMIERAALRGRDLCSQLLSFARADKPTLEPLSTLETVEEVIKISERTFPRDVRITVDAADDLPRMSGSRSQITQALMNLLVNARDAMPNGGRLTVRAHQSDGIPADELHYAERAGTSFVRLDVEDEGSGMSAEVVRRAFEPFFTTKSAAKGTGLGLPMAFSIAKAHGGAVRLWSTAGMGTQVSLFIPAAPAGSMVDRHESVADEKLESFAGSELVLIVDDEAMVRTVSGRVLRQFGYRTLEASSGPEALRILERESVDIVLLDIVMPEMEGPEVFQRMRKAGIDVPVLLCSGFSMAGLVDKLTKDGAAGFIQKPYRLQELLPRLREALDRRGAVGQQLTAGS